MEPGLKQNTFFIGKYQSLEYTEETNVKLQYLSQMGLSPGSEKNNNNWTNNNPFWLAYLMFRVHVMTIFSLGINVLTNWQKAALKLLSSGVLFHVVWQMGFKYSKKPFLRQGTKCLHLYQISPLSILTYSKDRNRRLRIFLTLQASC